MIIIIIKYYPCIECNQHIMCDKTEICFIRNYYSYTNRHFFFYYRCWPVISDKCHFHEQMQLRNLFTGKLQCSPTIQIPLVIKKTKVFHYAYMTAEEPASSVNAVGAVTRPDSWLLISSLDTAVQKVAFKSVSCLNTNRKKKHHSCQSCSSFCDMLLIYYQQFWKDIGRSMVCWMYWALRLQPVAEAFKVA